MTARALIETIYPELSASPSLEAYLRAAEGTVDKGFFGSLYAYAVAYKACHLFAMLGDSSGGGGSNNPAAGTAPIASMSEGGMGISYAVSASGKDGVSRDMENTKFGKLFLSLARSRPRMGVNRGGLPYTGPRS